MATSPRAPLIGLPTFRDSIRASSSPCSSMLVARRLRSRARSRGETVRQAGKASFARATAASVASTPASSRVAIVSSVAGSTTVMLKAPSRRRFNHARRRGSLVTLLGRSEAVGAEPSDDETAVRTSAGARRLPDQPKEFSGLMEGSRMDQPKRRLIRAPSPVLRAFAESCAGCVQVDVPGHRQNAFGARERAGVEAVTNEMPFPRLVVFRVHTAGKAAMEYAHPLGQPTIAQLDEEVMVIEEQCPCERAPSEVGRGALVEMQEQLVFVAVVEEDSAVRPARRDVVVAVRVDRWIAARHESKVPGRRRRGDPSHTFVTLD